MIASGSLILRARRTCTACSRIASSIAMTAKLRRNSRVATSSCGLAPIVTSIQVITLIARSECRASSARACSRPTRKSIRMLVS